MKDCLEYSRSALVSVIIAAITVFESLIEKGFFEKVRQKGQYFDEGLKITIDWYLNNEKLMKNLSSVTSNHTPWKSSN